MNLQRERMMIPIVFSTMGDVTKNSVFAISEDEKTIHICSEFCYKWLKKIKKEHFIEKVKPMILAKKMIQWEETEESNFEEFEWVMEQFKISDNELEEINEISQLFETFFKNRKLFSPYESLRHALNNSEPFLRAKTMRKIQLFLIENFHEHPDRMKMLLSNEIRKKINKKR